MTAPQDTPPDNPGHPLPETARFERRVPDGDDRQRLVCRDCGFVNYENPKIVVGSVAVWQDRVLLCRRAIAPRRGFWTLPAGYLELNEAAADGARREAWEEAAPSLRSTNCWRSTRSRASRRSSSSTGPAWRIRMSRPDPRRKNSTSSTGRRFPGTSLPFPRYTGRSGTMMNCAARRFSPRAATHPARTAASATLDPRPHGRADLWSPVAKGNDWEGSLNLAQDVSRDLFAHRSGWSAVRRDGRGGGSLLRP
jgi:hypothetical protein